jgi:hypothetical protein
MQPLLLNGRDIRKLKFGSYYLKEVLVDFSKENIFFSMLEK